MGGFDPYSSSKGCAELIVSSYKNSFFNLSDFKINHQTLIASARAGNVIGGGDWSLDRLIPDIIKSIEMESKTIIRYPKSTRPWQHVLEPLYGYLLLGEKLYIGDTNFAEAWNFGPGESESLAVEKVLKYSKKIWNRIDFELENNQKHPHEAGLLSLNIQKAKNKLGWEPKWNNKKSISKTIEWYKDFYNSNKINTDLDLKSYMNEIC